MNPSLRFIVNLCPRGTVAAIPRYENFFSNRHRLHQISITRPAAGRFIFLPSQPPSTRTGTKDDVTDTIETATLYERHMRSSSRSDEEPLQIEFSSVAAQQPPTRTGTKDAVRHCQHEASIQIRKLLEEFQVCAEVLWLGDVNVSLTCLTFVNGVCSDISAALRLLPSCSKLLSCHALRLHQESKSVGSALA